MWGKNKMVSGNIFEVHVIFKSYHIQYILGRHCEIRTQLCSVILQETSDMKVSFCHAVKTWPLTGIWLSSSDHPWKGRLPSQKSNNNAWSLSVGSWKTERKKNWSMLMLQFHEEYFSTVTSESDLSKVQSVANHKMRHCVERIAQLWGVHLYSWVTYTSNLMWWRTVMNVHFKVMVLVTRCPLSGSIRC